MARGVFSCPVCKQKFMSRVAVWFHRKDAGH